MPACSAVSDALAVMVESGDRAGGRERTIQSFEDSSAAAGARDHAEVLGIYISADEGCARKMDFSKFIVLKQLKSRTRRGVDAESLFVRKRAPHL